jgi:hypothetical protein
MELKTYDTILKPLGPELDRETMDISKPAKLKVGQTFMIESRYLYKWGKHDDLFDKGLDAFDYVEMDDYNKSILYICKYIGDGIMMEMTTRQNILMASFYNFEDDKKEDRIKTPTWVSSGINPYKIDDLKKRKEIEEEFRYNRDRTYLQRLEEYKEMIQKTPLVYHSAEGDYLYVIDDNSKREYIQTSEEERANQFDKLREEAVQAYENTMEELDKEIKEVKEIGNVPQEAIDMAYLENEIYDFENQSKTR